MALSACTSFTMRPRSQSTGRKSPKSWFATVIASAGDSLSNASFAGRLGYLRRTQVHEGKRRKYYQATAAGRKVLVGASGKLQELVREIIKDQDEPFQVIRRKREPKHRKAGRG